MEGGEFLSDVFASTVMVDGLHTQSAQIHHPYSLSALFKGCPEVP